LFIESFCLNLEINPYETIAFIGKTGSGKSSIVNLLLGFIVPERGEVLINDKNYLDYFFQSIDKIDNDSYYVNMAIAWFISVLFCKYRVRTLEYLKKNKLNDFIQNKAISKIRESFRVSTIDKKLVLKYKR